MAINEKLAARIREALAEQKQVEEKTMFKGMCFMVNDKMCLCVSNDEMLVRLGPDAYEAALEHNGVRPMINGGRTMNGYVYVDEEGMKTKKDFMHWVDLALAFNKDAKSSKKNAKPAAKNAKAVKKKK